MTSGYHFTRAQRKSIFRLGGSAPQFGYPDGGGAPCIRASGAGVHVIRHLVLVVWKPLELRNTPVGALVCDVERFFIAGKRLSCWRFYKKTAVAGGGSGPVLDGGLLHLQLFRAQQPEYAQSGAYSHCGRAGALPFVVHLFDFGFIPDVPDPTPLGKNVHGAGLSVFFRALYFGHLGL